MAKAQPKPTPEKRPKPSKNRSKHETALIQSAAVLFRKQGYAATGTAEILKRSGAPRGSLYYYFPEGKEAIGAAALEAASKVATRTFRTLAANSQNPSDFVERYAAMLTDWMEKSDFTDGCPVATTVLETVPQSDIISPVAKESFHHWRTAIVDMLLSHDWPIGRVHSTAALILSSFEGALIMARVERSPAPIRACANELSILLKG